MKRKYEKAVIALQILFFSIFLFLFLFPILIDEYKIHISFIKLSPFSYLSGIKNILTFSILILLLLVEIFYGRFFCGFICPLGNFIIFSDWIFKRIKIKIKNIKLKKNFFLWSPGFFFSLLLILKITGLNAIGFFDPISIINRFFTFIFAPLFKIEDVPLINNFSIILILIMLLSLFGERIWCKYFCPVGFIHKIVSLNPKYRREVEKCINCNACINICPMDAINIDKPQLTNFSQCILCGKCISVCPTKTTFKFKTKNKIEINYSRRKFIGSLIFSLIYLGLKRNETNQKEFHILRPPGATNNSILNNCLRCMECVKICPTGVLQPVSITKGFLYLFTPEFRPDLSYCDYECNLCTEICPNISIKKLSLNQKQKWQIGIAQVDRDRCLPWSKNIPCLVCEEHCPIPEKAIKIKIVNKEKNIGAPVVDKNLCIGCGLCQNKCPVPDSAIKVLYIYMPNSKKV